MKEQWRKIPGQPAWYEVSNLGRVRSLTHTFWYTNRRGTICSCPHKGRTLRPGLASSGYYSVAISKRSQNVHVLVARAFIGPCPVGHEVLHKNHIKSDCRSTNLKYGTRSQNLREDFQRGHRRTDNLAVVRRQKEFFKRIPWIGKLWTGVEFHKRFCPKFALCWSVTNRFKRGVSPAQIIADQHTAKRYKKLS